MFTLRICIDLFQWRTQRRGNGRSKLQEKLCISIFLIVYFYLYNRIMGLKVPTGDAAAMALRLMRTFGYEKVMPSVDTVNSHPEIKLLHAFSGEDYFIQPDVSRELAVQFENRVDLECTSYDSSEVTRATIEAFSGGAQTVSVNFVNEGHFLQKFRAQYLIDVILSLVSELSPTIEPDIDLSTN
ncbi:hypothetical protein Y032_0037g3441 [Ancylostoma ceylanicum]|uniref:Uncharacterized protein n=1 Tax=Ancylostoma ceylanicum TaxID=53326 RepID=A0A016UIU1_9BILA|nr:hypothetical protein Y032_0037g3441 [Ancylostoma ceylanicum]